MNCPWEIAAEWLCEVDYSDWIGECQIICAFSHLFQRGREKVEAIEWKCPSPTYTLD
jgi:hypothetical protein